MTNTKIITSTVIGFICLIAFACVAEQLQEARDFALTLQPIEARIPAGTTPKFRLTLTNITDHICRLLNIERRHDLQDNYFDLVVTKNGEPVELPRAISDPGPISDTNWLQIPRGATKTLTLTSFPEAYDRLPPDTYEAYVQFCPHPGNTNTYRSAKARFTVTK